MPILLSGKGMQLRQSLNYKDFAAEDCSSQTLRSEISRSKTRRYNKTLRRGRFKLIAFRGATRRLKKANKEITVKIMVTDIIF